MAGFAPPLHIAESRDRVRLCLGGLATADGTTLQNAADALARKVLLLATAVRSAEVNCTSFDLRVDPTLLGYLWRVGEIAATGGNIREAIFDPGAAAG